MKGQKIRLLRAYKGVKKGSVGTITGPCGCISNHGWTVEFEGHGEIIVTQRLVKGFEHYEVVI